MHNVVLFYLRWIGFWRLPETSEIRRVQSRSHLRRVDMLRPVWLGLVVVLAVVGQAALLTVSVLFMTFLSFMFLDEAQPGSVTVKVETHPRHRE